MHVAAMKKQKSFLTPTPRLPRRLQCARVNVASADLHKRAGDQHLGWHVRSVGSAACPGAQLAVGALACTRAGCGCVRE